MSEIEAVFRHFIKCDRARKTSDRNRVSNSQDKKSFVSRKLRLVWQVLR